jgi:glycosyltransferase involved in cell wall biosynthesis
MRVLWVKMGGLWPLNTGGRQRSFHMLSELARRHHVMVVTTHGPGDDPEGLERALPRDARAVSLPHTPSKPGSVRFAGALVRSWVSRYPAGLFRWRVDALRRRVDDLLNGASFDVVVVDFLVALPNVRAGRVPLVYFAHNVEHLICQRLRDVEPRWWRRVLLGIELRKMRKIEAQACESATLTVAVSESDRDHLAADAPSARIAAIPTGVDTGYFTPMDGEVPGRLVFSGSMDWYPNEDAVLYFVSQILPRVRQLCPEASLTVVGRNPNPAIRSLATRDGIAITGTVDDVRPHVAQASLCIVPLRVGGGTRLKIFEALAMGKATVSTTIGAEGLGVTPGTHLEVADGPEAFAAAIAALLRDPARRRSLGDAGRHLVETRFSWPSVTRAFEAHLEDARHVGRSKPVALWSSKKAVT